MNKILSVFAIILISNQASSQKTPFKYGKITEEECVLTECSFAPDASAMVLGELGLLNFKYNSDKGFQYQMDYSVRIKIFDQSADDLANVQIRIFHAKSGGKEEVSGIKASTYNLEDGKIIETKLEKDDIFSEALNERWDVIKFALPAVKAGSIIEYKYTLVSDYFSTLQSWQFQKDIPVKWSELDFTIPEYYNYQTIFRGYAPLSINESEIRQESFSYSYYTEIEHKTGGSSHKTGTFNSKSKHTHWVAENLLPLKQEPFMTSINDYAFQVDFQLQSIKYPEQPIKVVAGSYEKINEELSESTSFGKAIEKSDFTKNILTQVNKPESRLDYAIAIFEYIKNTIQWNEFNSIFTSQSLNQTLKNKKGNVADINFLLISTLQDAGIEAFPVVLSTRSNGKMHPIYPSYEKMNYVVAGVLIDGKEYLADASQKSLHFNLLNENCLNGKGFMITPSGGQWINLQKSPFTENTFVQLFLSDEELKGKIQSRKQDYAGYIERSKIIKNGEDGYISSKDAELSDWDISFSKIEYTNIYSPVESVIEVQQSISADKLFVDPILTGIKENPFKAETRTMAIDIPYGYKTKYTYSLTIPVGFKVVETPKPEVFSLPDKDGYYKYNLSIVGDKVLITTQFELNKLFYTVDEYPIIKQFYSMVAAKNNEVIVIVKE